MKKALGILFILMLGSSAAFADSVDDGLGQGASLQVKASTREMISAGIDENSAIGLTRLMLRTLYQDRQILKAHQVIREAKHEGLPAGPVMSKVREGITKNVQAEMVIRAMEQAQARYSYAYRQARSVDKTGTASTLGDTMAETMAAGMNQGDMDQIMSRLKTRERTMTKDQLHNLAIASYATARDMARSGVSSSTGSEVVCQALEHSWQERDMERLRSSFMTHARTGNTQALAAGYARAIRNGEDSSQIDSSQAREMSQKRSGSVSGSQSSGQGGPGTGGGSSSGNGGPSGGSGSGSGGSGSGSGSGGSGGGSGHGGSGHGGKGGK